MVAVTDGLRLGGVAEISAMLGVARTTVSTWATRHAEFPAPVAELQMGPVYDLDSVQRWYSRRASLTRADA